MGLATSLLKGKRGMFMWRWRLRPLGHRSSRHLVKGRLAERRKRLSPVAII